MNKDDWPEKSYKAGVKCCQREGGADLTGRYRKVATAKTAFGANGCSIPFDTVAV